MKNKTRSKDSAKWLCTSCGLYSCKEIEDICSTCRQVREEVGCRIGTLKSNKPKITFDKSAMTFILHVLDYSIKDDGYILNMYGNNIKCGVCKKNIHIDKFAGIVKDYGPICNNIVCLTTITNRLKGA